jgi:signal transduction histidine kinase
MRLTLKLVLAFILANATLAGVYGYLSVRREVDRFRKQAEVKAQELSLALETPLIDAWRKGDLRGMREWLARIHDAPQESLHIRLVLFDDDADPDFRPAAPVWQWTAIFIQEHDLLDDDEPDCLYVYRRAALSSDRKGWLEFTFPKTALKAEEREIVQRAALLVGGMLLISGLLAVLLGLRLIGRPLEQLMAKARRIGEGDLGGPLRLRSRDELAELAEDLNALCAKLADSQDKLRQEAAARIVALEQLRHADRLKTVGRLASGIAHELGTPLNVVAGRAGLIASGKLDSHEIAQSAAAIKAEADKMTAIIRQLLDFARASAPRKAPTDLRTVVRQTIDMLDSIARKQKVELLIAADAEEAVAQIDTGQIQQVLTNLAMNAIQAMPDGGQVRFSVGHRAARPPAEGTGSPAAFYAVEVRDQGVGIPEEHLQQLFEPFFTTKEIGAGTGLGLSIAYGIVQEHGGWIDVASRVGEGSCFTVYLPQGANA